MTLLESLLNNLPQTGVVRWIGLRPQRRAKIVVVDNVRANTDTGLVGDRYKGSGGARQVTLIQWEHLAVIASLLGEDEIDPARLRRNIAISGINLIALKNKRFRIGTAELNYTGLCHPCSFMEESFGDGGYNAVRGHGGITAQVLVEGDICVGDSVRAIVATT